MPKKDKLQLDLSSDTNDALKKDQTRYGKKFMDKVRKLREEESAGEATKDEKLEINKTDGAGESEQKTDDPSVKRAGRRPSSSAGRQTTDEVDLRQTEEMIEKEQAAVEEAIKKQEDREEQEEQEEEKISEEQAKELEAEKVGLDFPDGFLWGTATSAYQIEGGNHNDWTEWENSPERKDRLKKKGEDPYDYICGNTCDSYNRYEEDFKLCLRLNNSARRLGIEWSRVEPKEGVWNVEAIKHYRKVVEHAKEKDFKVILTLWHWTNPIWIAKQGGWTNKKTVDSYLKYVDVMVKELGANIDYWVTLNEPLVPISFGYLTGGHPPGKKFNLIGFYKAFNNLVDANNRAYDIIHDHFPSAQTGVSMLSNYIMPARRWCPVEWGLAKLADYFSIKLFLNKIDDSFDFIGLNYYKMNRVVWYPPFKRNKKKKISDMGWEVYPEGIYYELKSLARYGRPIIITENGIADEDDKLRGEYIVDHLKYVHKAIKEGVKVLGYFHWSLLDNFEWAFGFGPKFGLHKIDKDTFWRTPRPSVKLYADICKNNKIMINKN